MNPKQKALAEANRKSDMDMRRKTAQITVQQANVLVALYNLCSSLLPEKRTEEQEAALGMVDHYLERAGIDI